MYQGRLTIHSLFLLMFTKWIRVQKSTQISERKNGLYHSSNIYVMEGKDWSVIQQISLEILMITVRKSNIFWNAKYTVKTIGCIPRLARLKANTSIWSFCWLCSVFSTILIIAVNRECSDCFKVHICWFVNWIFAGRITWSYLFICFLRIRRSVSNLQWELVKILKWLLWKHIIPKTKRVPLFQWDCNHLLTRTIKELHFHTIEGGRLRGKALP